MATNTDNTRAELAQWLSDLLNLTRYIEDRWAERATIAQPYEVAMKPAKKPWRVGAYFLSVIASIIVFNYPVKFLIWIVTQDYGITNLLGTLICVGIGIAIPPLYNRKLLPKRNEKISQENATLAEKMRLALTPVDDQLNQAGQTYATKYASRYPEAYAYSDAVAFCLQAVQNHRAETVGQAINLYENVLHQNRLEQNQAAILHEQERTRQQQAVNATINAAMQAATIRTMRSEGAATRKTMRSEGNDTRNTIRSEGNDTRNTIRDYKP